MSAVTASPYWTLLFVVFVSADQKIILAVPGQDVTLTCRAPKNNVIVVEWSRADLEDEYVLLYRDGRFVPDDQHPSFKNRVDLQDRQMKDGDVSLILKDVTINDTGTYVCGVFVEGEHSWEIIITYLRVVPPGQTGGQEKDEDNKDGGKEDKEKEDGSVGLIVGLSVSAELLILVAVVGFWIYKRKHDSKPHNDPETRQPLCTPELNCDSDDLKMN
ncbi:uncharacterized protein LOC120438323 [Oreochromis aureus]|uniref:uncharacterized protein LOC120438323 n=1 Tax=Oreochromis aureus TaxID=47969 RepID=UPI001953A121|nr:uncharacterized protein LOC120438323 [Oreochromis aureus]